MSSANHVILSAAKDLCSWDAMKMTLSVRGKILPLAIDTPVMPTRIKAVVVQCNVALLLLQRLQHSKE
jgi:hypothetical protein